MGRKMTARVVQRRAQVGLEIARMRRPGGPRPPLLPERADGRQAAKLGSGLLRRWFQLAPRSFAALVPGRRPARGGRGGRPCRRRQKRRRCESSGLRAPFLCPETESGVEGGSRSTCRVLGVPLPPLLGLSRTRSDTRAITCVSFVLFLRAISC